MKKIIGLLLITTLFNACDDGDVQIETVDLSDAQTKKCQNDILYQINDNKAMFMRLDSVVFKSSFINEIGTRSKTIDNSINKLLYRIYNGTVVEANICDDIQPINPITTEEWIAEYGTLSITTTAVKSAPVESGFSKIIKYKHAMVLQNIGWKRPDGNIQLETERPFGNYSTDANVISATFNKDSLVKSSCDKSLYTTEGRESMQLKFDDTTYNYLFPAISVNGTRIATLTDANKLTFTLYNSLVTNANFCSTTAFPIVKELWLSDNGTATTGIIEVITEVYGTSTTQFRNIVSLKATTLKRGNNDLYLGTSYKLGEFISSN